MTPRFAILATVIETGETFECFTWTRSAESGIARAKADAVRFGHAGKLTDFRAERIGQRICETERGDAAYDNFC